MIEEWKDISGYEGRYQISNFGRVKSCDRLVNRCGRYMHVAERIMHQSLAANGYYVVNLNNQGYKTFYIHRLVADAFIPNPFSHKCIDHIDANRLNNTLENLKWCSYSENNNNPITRKRMSDGSKGFSPSEEMIEKLRLRISKPVRQMDLDGKLIKVWESPQTASKQLGLCSQTIYRCCNHPERSKSAGGFKWEYEK